MPIKAVIFDLDGTLLDTLDDLADAGNAMLDDLGYPTHPNESYKHFVGDGMSVLVRRALPVEGMDDFSMALERMRTAYALRWNVKSRPYPGIPELLDALVGKGLSLAVLSNKPEDFCQLTVRHYFEAWPWAAIKGETATIPRKPDPAGALAIAGQLGLTPRECLFVGDSPMDIACALNAGMNPVAVSWGFRAEEDLRQAGATVVAHSPADILNAL